MNKNIIKNIVKDLKKVLNFEKIMHSFGVANTASSLALFYNYDLDKAYIAGLLHDYCKFYKNEDYIKLMKEYNVHFDLKFKERLHGFGSSYIAKYKYGILDEDIINSIKYHTVANKDMNLLGKIIFLSDYIEPLRYNKKYLNDIRQLVYKDINKAIYLKLKARFEFFTKKNLKYIDKFTIEAYDFFSKYNN